MRKKLAENHSGRRGENVMKFLLKNKVYCGICGERITSDAGTARDGSLKRYYKCIGREKHKCSQPTIRKNILGIKAAASVKAKRLPKGNLLHISLYQNKVPEKFCAVKVFGTKEPQA